MTTIGFLHTAGVHVATQATMAAADLVAEPERVRYSPVAAVEAVLALAR